MPQDGANTRTQTITPTENSSGASAGTTNALRACRPPMSTAAAPASAAYGTMTRKSPTALAIFAGSGKATRMRVIGAAASTATPISGTVTASCSPNAACANSPWARGSRCRASAGTSAAENAPSANRRRRVLGTWNMTVNTSTVPPAPNTAASTAARTKPSARLAAVQTMSSAAVRSVLPDSGGRVAASVLIGVRLRSTDPDSRRERCS